MNENTRWKIDVLKEYVRTNNIILMNFTETWLKKKMQDEKIPNYTTFRCDRKSKNSKGGGTAIYLKMDLRRGCCWRTVLRAARLWRYI